MEYLNNRVAAIRKRLAQAQDRVTLAQEDVVALTQELEDIIYSRDWLAAHSQTGQDVQRYTQAVEQPDPLPSKAYLLIDPSDEEDMTTKLDFRFDPVAGLPVGNKPFSKNFLRTVFFSGSRYPVRHFTLRHPKAGACPIKQRCEHWRLVEENISRTRGRWDVDIQVTAIRADFVAGGDSGHSGVSMFDQDEVESENISGLPCRIFGYLQPDFGAVEQRRYKVLDWHLHEPDSAGFMGDKIHRLKLMDQFGRRVFENLEQAYARCMAYDKACQYTASRRGGLDRAALTERRRRLANKADAQLDSVVSEISVAVADQGITLGDEAVTGADCVEGFHASLPVPTPVLENRDTPQFSHDGFPDDALVRSYYTNFHHLHPFAPPFKHLVQLSQASAFNFSPLIASMRLIGHIYDTHQWSEPLSSAIEAQISQLKPSDAVQVQARLLYSIALFWYTFKAEAKEQMDAAIDVAVRLEMHKQEFAATLGFGDPIMVECWRRTWWMVFIVDASYAGTLGTMNFKTLHVKPTAELPCEESDYESGIIPTPKTLQDFDSREFDSEDVVFSSFAYLIGAVRCAAQVICMSPKRATREHSEAIIQSADSAFDAWLLLLPKDKKPVLKADGTIDELMFQAHLLIHVCAREPPADTPKPDLINVHTTRILKSVNAQIQLLALPVRPFHHTPFTTCMVSEGTLALLSACTYMLKDQALAVARDQIRLTIGCLKAVGEVWPRTARNVKEIQTIARHVLGLGGSSADVGSTPGSTQVPSLTQSEGEGSMESLPTMDEDDTVFATLGSFEDICGWINMGVELDSRWMEGSTN
ncbi:C6 transcription factor [Fusarium denticulatum]|uniref:C6 transcription factor n=1 Tax=Fusarium denticulatum TaxID=48507 RepID=A0A8H6CWI8_9HYPO|nr:C6 transcription factor [Fusarium denticulatum]